MAVVIGKGSFRGFGETPNRGGDEQEDLPIDKAIGNKLQQIAYNVNQLKTFDQNIGTELDTVKTRNKTSDLIAETNQLTKDTNELIKTFNGSEPVDQDSQNKWKIQVRRLKELFHDQLTDYQSIQKAIRNKQRTVIRTSLQKSGNWDIDIDEKGDLVKDGQQIQVETIQAEVDLDLMKERENALKQIEQDIIDVNEIFKDLAGMICDQGDMIDEAEVNIEQAAEDVEIAVEEVHEAADTMQAIRKKKLFIVAIISVVVVVIVLIIVLTQVT